MINDSLLRLFNSEFFNAWIAVSYLFKYSGNAGIQRYLCDSLKKFPSAEIEFFLPQLMHLLVTQPSVSVSLEETLIDLGKQSPHFAVMSLWYLETYMADWGDDPNSLSYLLCQRILYRIQAIIVVSRLQPFGSTNETKTPPSQLTAIGVKSGTSNQSRQSSFGFENISDYFMSDNYNPGISSSSSSSSCSSRSLSRQSSQHSTTLPDISPIPSSISFPIAISTEDLQGGSVLSLSQYLVNHMKWPHHKSLHGMHNGMVRGGGPIGVEEDVSNLDITTRIMGSSSVPINDGHPPSPAPFTTIINDDYRIQQQQQPIRRSHSSISNTIGRTPQHHDRLGHHLPSLELSLSSSSSSSFSPRASMDTTTTTTTTTTTVNNSRGQNKQQYSGYFKDEMQFLTALSDIAERLVAVPRHARTNALHTELTLLNHHLPTEICLPLWCSGGCSSLHHHVVRLTPYDAVVLNSAERAPYLLMIEVLEEDMNLDQRIGDDSVLEITTGLDDNNNDDDLHDFDNRIGQTSGVDSNTSDFSRQMRMAAVMLAQLQQQQQDTNDPNLVMMQQAIRQRVIDQMVSLDEQRMNGLEQKMPKQLDRNIKGDHSGVLQQAGSRAVTTNQDDPSAVVLSEDWQVKKERIRQESPFGHLPNWRLLSVIVKQGTDLRQEQFTIQLIHEMQKIWLDAGVDAWVKYYRVLVTSDKSGLIETIRNTISIHSIKKNAYTKLNKTSFTLKDYFEQRWGSPTSSTFRMAQDAFMKSLVGYSIACYLLQIKDRHNGNLLLDDQGHLIHIDFGFVLSTSPGSLGFEKAPFKLSQEYIDVLGGVDSELFGRYRILIKQAFKAVRKYSDNLVLLVEMMSKDSNMPCFQTNPDYVLQQLKERFQSNLTDHQLDIFVDKLIMNSCGSYYTRLYDTYQYYSQGIL